MKQSFQRIPVIKIGPLPMSRRIAVWSEISWMNRMTSRVMKKRLKGSPVERAGKMGSIALWALGDKVEVAPTDEEG